MIFLFFIGIVLGVVLCKAMPKAVERLLVKKEQKWKVSFHTRFLIHERGCETNSMVRSPTVEIYVLAESESEAADLVLEMIQQDLRIEIESVELWLI